MHRSAFATAALILVFTPEARAQDITKLDHKQVLAIYDLNRDGVLSPEELRLYVRDVQIARARQRARGEAPVKPADPAKPAPAQPRHDDIQGVLLLRDVYSVPVFLSDSDELSKNGASFTVTNDRLAGNTTLAGKGGLFYALYGNTSLNTPGTVDPNALRLTHFAFVPGLEWDIKSKGGKNTGAVSGRAGMELEFQGGGPITTQYLRADAIYTTDVATNRAELFGTQLSWMPMASDYWIGVSRHITADMYFNFVPTLNSDYFHVGQTGTFDNLMPNHDYWWVGPKLQANIFFGAGPLKDVSFYAKYFYLYDLLNGRSTTVNYLQAGAIFGLASWETEADPTKRAKLSLALRYTTGRTPQTLEKTEELYAGLNIKLGDLPK